MDSELSLGVHPELVESDDSQTDSTLTQPEITPDVSNLMTLDRTNLYREFDRLQREDPEFANALNTLVGNKAKLRYQPQIDDLRDQLTNLTRQQRQAQMTSMTPETVQQRFATDPQFAREYTDFVHQTGTSAPPDDSRQVQRTVENMFDVALSMGLPQDRVKQFQQDIAAGKYDKDESGYAYSSWQQSVSRLQQDIMQEVWRNGSPAVASQQTTQKPQGQINPRLLEGGPDTSSTGRTQAKTKYTASQISNMNPMEILQLFPNDGDYERAVSSGLIEGINPYKR